jgi:hypothetical protein
MLQGIHLKILILVLMILSLAIMKIIFSKDI